MTLSRHQGPSKYLSEKLVSVHVRESGNEANISVLSNLGYVYQLAVQLKRNHDKISMIYQQLKTVKVEVDGTIN